MNIFILVNKEQRLHIRCGYIPNMYGHSLYLQCELYVGIVCPYDEFVWAQSALTVSCVGTADAYGELCGHSLSLWLVVWA